MAQPKITKGIYTNFVEMGDALARSCSHFDYINGWMEWSHDKAKYVVTAD